MVKRFPPGKVQIHNLTYVRPNRFYPEFRSPPQRWVAPKRKGDHLISMPEDGENPLRTLVPGMVHILDSKKPIWYRFIWVSVLLASTVMCVYQVSMRIRLYWLKATVFQSVITINDTIRYPALTICGTNYFASSELVHQYSNSSTACEINWMKLVGENGMNVYEVWESNKISNYIDYTGFPLASRVSPETPDIQRTTVPTLLGFCETFNLENNVIRYEPGFFTCFKLTTKAHKNCEYKYLKIRVHSPEESVRHTTFRASFDIKPGRYTDVVLSLTKIKSLNTKDDPCVDVDIYNRCRDQCIDEILNNNITCRLPFMEVNLPYCSDTESVKVAFESAEHVYHNTPECAHCKKKCIEEKYGINLSPWENDQNTTNLYLYYKDNVFSTGIEVIAYDFGSCVADIGGNLGLFLGFCILHLLEILDSIVRNIIAGIKLKK